MRENDECNVNGCTFGFGAELTIALSWPRVIESRSLLCYEKDGSGVE
jgi:hypothetical protein